MKGIRRRLAATVNLLKRGRMGGLNHKTRMQVIESLRVSLDKIGVDRFESELKDLEEMHSALWRKRKLEFRSSLSFLPGATTTVIRLMFGERGQTIGMK
jgi:hypothetical protein